MKPQIASLCNGVSAAVPAEPLQVETGDLQEAGDGGVPEAWKQFDNTRETIHLQGENKHVKC